MTRTTDLLRRGRRALIDGREIFREYRARQAEAARAAGASEWTPADDLFPVGEHAGAADVIANRLRVHRHLDDYSSRLCELVEYFGLEIAPRRTGWSASETTSPSQ